MMALLEVFFHITPDLKRFGKHTSIIEGKLSKPLGYPNPLSQVKFTLG
jgi:hypothetical protein